jgi:hypothetical protein
MSDGKPKLDIGEAIAIVIGLAAANAISEKEVGQDPERLAPQRERQKVAFDVVEEFLEIHLYGDCTPCE